MIPHEYRKHFPIEMKDHNSHDVLLLCTSCHAISNYYDNHLKQQLAREQPPSSLLTSWPVRPEAPPVGPSPQRTGGALLLGSPAEPRSCLPGPGLCSLTALMRWEKLLEAKN